MKFAKIPSHDGNHVAKNRIKKFEIWSCFTDILRPMPTTSFGGNQNAISFTASATARTGRCISTNRRRSAKINSKCFVSKCERISKSLRNFCISNCGDVIVTCCYSVNSYRSLPKKRLQFSLVPRFGYITPKNRNFQYALPMTGERTQENSYIIDL